MNQGYAPPNQRAHPPPHGQRFYESSQRGPGPQQPAQNRFYDQRPPPQRSAQRAPPPRQQQSHLPMQQPVYDNGGGYEYNEGYGAYDDGYYDEHVQYDQGYDQRYQQDYDQRQDRQYHYDERYRMNGRRPQPQQHPQDYREPAAPGRMQHAPADTSRAPKERERILQARPESPKSVPWDNPFGAFPSKKPQGNGNNSKNEDSPGKPAVKTTQEPRENASPSSKSHQATVQRSQFHAPDPNRTSGPGDQRMRNGNMPPRKNISRPPSNNSYQSDRGPRVPPQRAMTEPDFGRRYDEYNQQQTYHDQYQGSTHEQSHNGYSDSRQYEPQYDVPQQRQSHTSEQTYADTAYNVSSENSRHVSQQPSTQNRSKTSSFDASAEARYPSSSHSIAAATVGGVTEIPNFDNIISNANEDQLSTPQTTKPMQAYKKPTYQTSNAPQSAQEPLSSSLAAFSFGLSPKDNTSDPSLALDQQLPNRGHDVQAQQVGTLPNSGPSTIPSQYPPRSASRGDMRPPPRDQYGQPPMPHPGQIPHQQLYDQFDSYTGPGRPDQNRGGQYENDYDYQSGPPLTRPPPLRDPSRSGYDPRLHGSAGGSQVSLQQLGGPPPRPMTSNSVQLPVGGYGQRTSSDSYAMSVRSQPDLSSRPVPFRPGLMQPTPPPPQQVETQTFSPAPKPNAPTDAKAPPITIQELNLIRQTYQSRPDDKELGLRFAKKLVEAARVLSNEGGRADAKQTAKNRERYIMDAHKIIKRLIAAGYTDAMFYMADCHGQGMLGLQADPKEAFSLYQSAAKLGHAQAAYRVAVCCELGPEEGGGTRRDPLKAVQWYKRAASLGDTPAMYKMGMIQLKGLLGQPRSPRDAISWLKRAAERADKENPHALHELGLLYESAQPNDVALRDEAYALQLFTQAAEFGYKYSQFRLGSAYEYGLLGCAIDPRMSIAWYSRAAAQGEHQSEFALSGWYLTGGGPLAPGQPPLLEQNDTEAYLWARKAASSGLAKAEYAMGYYTEVGIGVASNIEEAKKWYFRAAAQSHPKARQRLEDLRRGGARMQKTRVSRSNVGKQNEGECVVM